MSLKIQNLCKSFHQGEHSIQVLKNLELELQTGEIAAVVGQSGSGKSTFLSLIAGLERADQGDIIVNGSNLSTMNETELTQFRARSISLVFQQYHLVQHLTALENVMLPLEILKILQPQKKAAALLDQLGLNLRQNHRPSQLSGGECQRVAIARALVVQPQLLLADEPSGNLDLETGKKVMDIFFEVVKFHKITTLVVTHSETLAQKCQRILTLSQGQLQS